MLYQTFICVFNYQGEWTCFSFYWITGVTLVNKIYMFQVHNSTTYHLYTVLCVHHPKSSLHPSPFTPPYPPLPPSAPPTTGSHHTVVCVHELFSLFFFFAQSPPPPRQLSACMESLINTELLFFIFCTLVWFNYYSMFHCLCVWALRCSDVRGARDLCGPLGRRRLPPRPQGTTLLLRGKRVRDNSREQADPLSSHEKEWAHWVGAMGGPVPRKY